MVLYARRITAWYHRGLIRISIPTPASRSLAVAESALLTRRADHEQVSIRAAPYYSVKVPELQQTPPPPPAGGGVVCWSDLHDREAFAPYHTTGFVRLCK